VSINKKLIIDTIYFFIFWINQHIFHENLDEISSQEIEIQISKNILRMKNNIFFYYNNIV